MTVIYASPDGGPVEHEGRTIQTFTPGVAVARTQPGDIVELLPGRYRRPFSIDTGGTEESPLVIRGQDDGTVILDGGQVPEVARSTMDPMDDDFWFIRLHMANWVTVIDLTLENCWPMGIFIRGCKHVTIKNCHVTGSRFAIYARNRWGLKKTGHLMIDNVTWVQDPDHDMWDGRITWNDVKKRHPYSRDASYLNGAIFGSFDIKGPVTIRKCEISHAFNAIRMDARTNNIERNRNREIYIYDNHFSYIRDNAIEPEKVAYNLWVFDNILVNVHAAFSLDGVAGGYWYYFGNRILNGFKPGLEGQPNRGGKIFKFHEEGPWPDYPFYAFHNSIRTRTAYTKSGRTNLWHHYNNAISICRSGEHCDADREMFPISTRSFEWRQNYDFENDLCDHPDFPDALRAAGFLVDGIAVPDGVFADPREESLELAEGSPGFDASIPITVALKDGGTWNIPGGLNLGVDGDRLPKPISIGGGE